METKTELNRDELIGCWVDGATPRTPRQRCERLLDLGEIVGLNRSWWIQEIKTACADNSGDDCDYALADLEVEMLLKIHQIISPLGLEISIEAWDVVVGYSD